VPAAAPIPAFDVLLIAPNVSEQMGGEGIKALQIYRELANQGVRVHQITHIRVKPELDRNYPDMHVTYIEDTLTEKLLYRAKLFEQLLNFIFLRSATRLAEQLLRSNPDAQQHEAIVHFTSPVSPILPYPVLRGARTIIGPNNGNIHYPPAFYHREGIAYKIRRWMHPPMQWLHKLGPSGKRRASAILVAGGQRTYESLRLAGCRDAQFVDSIDSGVVTRLAEAPRILHSGENLRFFHNGRLVAHKGTDLVIKALARTRLPVRLDIIGRGPQLPMLRALTKELHLEERVTFTEWVADHSELTRMMREYRAFVFPSLAEANGIVVQEAMMQGLPVVALNWGGPALLVTSLPSNDATGVLIEPSSEEHVIAELAAAMDLLATNGELAEQMSLHARAAAMSRGFLWADIIADWRKLYARLKSTSSTDITTVHDA
jgi:glycosyltransferase involved in cell wall biosynthesis